MRGWFGRKDEGEKPPLTIQQLESLMSKRKGKMGSITLLIEGEAYRLLPEDEYERIMRVVVAVEAMSKKMEAGE